MDSPRRSRTSCAASRGCLITGLLLPCLQTFADCEQRLRRGDANSDGKLDLSDPVFTLGFLFLGTARPECLDALDSDDTGDLGLTDAVFALLFLFAGGDPLPAPGHLDCGLDPTEDDLGCASGAPCEPAGDCVPCSSNAECAPGSFCSKAPGDCGGRGICKERPTICPRIFDPVCGCDGQTYSNDCEAAAAGVSVEHRGECLAGSCADNVECPKGFFCSKAVGDCDGKGECRERPEACLQVFDPVCGCDGRTYGNDCEAAAAGINVAHKGECGQASCADSSECPPGEFCSKAVGDCGGTGACTPRPQVCPDVFDPVCGCDGQTYSNDCVAAAAGVSVEHGGECGQASCADSSECPLGQFCAKDPGDCGGAGACKPRPEACPDVFDPVCGCDGTTYGNACEAAAAGASVAHRGECGSSACTGNEDCPAGFFCSKDVADCGGAGACKPRPEVCPLIFKPVCGCDGVTYGNACEAAAAGASVLHEGPCEVASCKANDECPFGQFCEKDLGDCDGAGRCSVLPDVCPENFDPVCGCDGKTYSNECNAFQAGVSVARRGACDAAEQ